MSIYQMNVYLSYECLSILIVDVLLLADVFEAFRRMALLNYKLDPAFYITSPHLSFRCDAAQNMG